MTLAEISHWTVSSGVGHVLTGSGGGWVTTACGSWQPGDVTNDRPARICRRCRAAVGGLRPAGVEVTR